ncbi:MAG: hypothetical protein GYB32_04620 [Algicola sp.]|nr:hypothetical protein [Algicola sp.]
MRSLFVMLIFCLGTSLNHSVQAQNQFAKLEKNVNVRAQSLEHKLNASRDTLLLKSNTNIQRVYSVSMDYKREIDLAIHKKATAIPLTNLSNGKHVFVVKQSGMRIVFVIKIIGNDEQLLAMDDNLLVTKNNH